MPTSKELMFQLEDRPGSLAKVCRSLADSGVNILAFQSVASEGKGRVRCVVDNPIAAKRVLDNEGLSYSEADVAQVRLGHRPGELARVSAQLGEAEINIKYAYCGVDSTSNTPVMIFGVEEVEQAAAILDRTAAAA